MNDHSQHTRERWNELARAGVEYSKPWLDLSVPEARERVDPLGLLGELQGRCVLCLAASGGQQTAAFGLLGARVTVLDLSDEMLARDKIAARHYGHEIATIQGDACDLSFLSEDRFDIVWQAHSISFIRDLVPLFDGIARVLRKGGLYHLSAWNPLAYGADALWTGKGYLFREGYVEGLEVVDEEGHWIIVDENGCEKRVLGPREFRHTLTAIMNGLIHRGFIFLNIQEESHGRADAQPGTWDHFCSVVPPWLHIWAALRPDVVRE